MKYTTLLLICFTTQSILAQDASMYQNVTKKFQENFNAQDINAVFNMYTSDLQKSTTKEGVSRFINGCHEQFGNIKNITFTETIERVYSYKVEFDKTILAMDLQLSNDGKISTIQLQEL
jgi:hypothetical protein